LYTDAPLKIEIFDTLNCKIRFSIHRVRSAAASPRGTECAPKESRTDVLEVEAERILKSWSGLVIVETEKRIQFVNRSYWPDAEATGQLLTELCEDLATERQLKVSVICGQPNFNLDNVEFEQKGVQNRNGVEIIRVNHTKHDKSTFTGRITNFVTYLVAAFWTALWSKKPDLMIVQTDPPLLCLLGCIVSRMRGIKYVCYLQDVYPDIAVKLGRLKENLLTKFLRWSFLKAYRSADKVVVVGSDMKKWLVNHRVDANKITIIENWVDTESLQPIKTDNQFRKKFDLEDKFVVMYSGNMGYTQRFDLIMDTAEKLQDRNDIVFAFVGNGVKRRYLTEETISRGLPNIRFMDYQPKSELSQSLSAADIHLVLLDSKLTPYMLPSKIYSAFASATAVICMGSSKTQIGNRKTSSHLANLIERHEAGLFIDEEDAETLAEEILALQQDHESRQRMSHNSRVAAETLHTRGVAISEFQDTFIELGILSEFTHSGHEVPPRSKRGSSPDESVTSESNSKALSS